MLRLPDGLRDRIKASADAQGRSMNAEIVLVLEREFPDPWSVTSGLKVPMEGELATSGGVERMEVRELMGRYLNAVLQENETLKRAGALSHSVIYYLAYALQKAAEGDNSELEHQIERAKREPKFIQNLLSTDTKFNED
jgi:plasmid stability protein